VQTQTGTESGAGTDANVFVQLYGEWQPQGTKPFKLDLSDDGPLDNKFA
jgi:hypothetical protein